MKTKPKCTAQVEECQAQEGALCWASQDLKLFWESVDMEVVSPWKLGWCVMTSGDGLCQLLPHVRWENPWPWVDFPFPIILQTQVFRSARPCWMSWIIPLSKQARMWLFFFNHHLRHHSQLSCFWTPCLTPISFLPEEVWPLLIREETIFFFRNYFLPYLCVTFSPCCLWEVMAGTGVTEQNKVVDWSNVPGC